MTSPSRSLAVAAILFFLAAGIALFVGLSNSKSGHGLCVFGIVAGALSLGALLRRGPAVTRTLLSLSRIGMAVGLFWWALK